MQHVCLHRRCLSSRCCLYTADTHAPLSLRLWFAASSTESEQLGTRKWEEGVSQGWEDGADGIDAPHCSRTLAGIHPTTLLVCYTLHQAN